MTHTNTLGRTPWTRDQPVTVTSTLQRITLNKKQTAIFLVRFEPAIRTSERQQACTLDRAAIGIGLEGILTSRDLNTSQCPSEGWEGTIPVLRVSKTCFFDFATTLVGRERRTYIPKYSESWRLSILKIDKNNDKVSWA